MAVDSVSNNAFVPLDGVQQTTSVQSVASTTNTAPGRRAAPQHQHGKHLMAVHSSADTVAAPSVIDAAFSGERLQLEEFMSALARRLQAAAARSLLRDSLLDFLLGTQRAMCQQAESADGIASDVPIGWMGMARLRCVCARFVGCGRTLCHSLMERVGLRGSCFIVPASKGQPKIQQ